MITCSHSLTVLFGSETESERTQKSLFELKNCETKSVCNTEWMYVKGLHHVCRLGTHGPRQRILGCIQMVLADPYGQMWQMT